MRRALICFTRVPAPGQTKTRLLPILSAEQCAELHLAFLRDIAKVVGSVDCDVFVFHTPADAGILREIFPDAVFEEQTGETLGMRMDDAIRRVLERGYEACVLIGSDLPLLTRDHISSAFDALVDADVTLGPTPDGGYYLVGMKEPHGEVFEEQTYGHGKVYEQAVRAMERARGDSSKRAEGADGGRSCRFRAALPCRDVDTPEDLAWLCTEIVGTRTFTERLLEEWKK